MAGSGISRIDQLFEGQNLAPIVQGDPDLETVRVIQDFLVGHGFREIAGSGFLPDGQFGPRTADAVRTFQGNHNLSTSGAVDRPTLRAIVDAPASNPIASRGYITLVLDFIFSGMVRVMSLTTCFEGAGRFTAINRNTDKAGLSFGLIQWAQKPGRLNELLRAFQQQQPQNFVRIFGGGDAALAQALTAHTAKQGGGVDSQGRTTDPRFDLVSEPWVSRFHQAALERNLQRVQVNLALSAFRVYFQRLQAFAPPIRSERGVAFMLDLANQHGNGGAKSIFTKVQKLGLSEAELLKAIQEESVARVRAQFGEGNEVVSTQNRREAFRTSPLLSDAPFSPA